jgi:hypothetical protein
MKTSDIKTRKQFDEKLTIKNEGNGFSAKVDRKLCEDEPLYVETSEKLSNMLTYRHKPTKEQTDDPRWSPDDNFQKWFNGKYGDKYHVRGFTHIGKDAKGRLLYKLDIRELNVPAHEIRYDIAGYPLSVMVSPNGTVLGVSAETLCSRYSWDFDGDAPSWSVDKIAKALMSVISDVEKDRETMLEGEIEAKKAILESGKKECAAKIDALSKLAE